MFAHLLLAALTIAPIEADSMSPEARYDLKCFTSAIIFSKNTTSEAAKPGADIMAYFYLGRLSTRYKESNWGERASREVLKSPHDVSWYLGNIEECNEKMKAHMNG